MSVSSPSSPGSGTPQGPRNHPRAGTTRTRNRLESVWTLIFTSVLIGAVIAGMSVPLLGGVALGSRSAISDYDSLPEALRNEALPQRTYLLDNQGKQFATLYKENRVVVPLSEISPLLQQAAIATEDARFYEHNGVDTRGALRALVANSKSGDVAQGSSTITMQYVRNLLITNAKNKEKMESARVRGGLQGIVRKVQEMRYAMALERHLTKDQILAGYLNIAYFGSGAYGAEAASKHYFSKKASELDLPQAALLAGLVQRPVGYDPTVNPTLAKERRDVVLDRMLSQKMITQRQAARAKRTTIKSNLKVSEITNGCADSRFPFYCDFVVTQLKQNPALGATEQERSAVLERGGFTIQTALDRKIQEAGEAAIANRIPKDDPSRKAGAMAVVEPGTGNVLALAQNRDWGTKGRGKTTYNYAVNQAQGGTIGMQAGSTFKIFTLAAALEKDIDPNSYIYSPPRMTFAPGRWGCGSKGEFFPSYTVNNSTSSGTMNMFTATAYSVNTYFVELQRQAGLCNTVNVAERMGVKTATGNKLPRVPSFTLGSIEVSPLSVANAYATMAAHGLYCEPHSVDTIKGTDGATLLTDTGACRQAVSRDVADATTAILTNVIDGNIAGRTGAKMSIGSDAAGKTGTTDSNAAVWFAGYTPNTAAAVWVGDPRGGFQHPMQDIVINGTYYDKVHGLSIPGPIWQEVMETAVDERGRESFDLQAKYDLHQAR